MNTNRPFFGGVFFCLCRLGIICTVSIVTDTAQFSINSKECPKCGAIWLNGVHYWATGHKGNELDLAGLVCNTTQSSMCINAMKGKEGGDTWEKRLQFIEKLEDAPQSSVGVWGADLDGLD